jgi:hypothetical protein
MNVVDYIVLSTVEKYVKWPSMLPVCPLLNRTSKERTGELDVEHVEHSLQDTIHLLQSRSDVTPQRVM